MHKATEAPGRNVDVQAQVGSMLRVARRRRGWTLREAAAASGDRFKSSTLAAYEVGRRSITIGALYDLAELYDTSVSALLAEGIAPNDRASTLVEYFNQLPPGHRELVFSLVEQMYRDTALTADLHARPA